MAPAGSSSSSPPAGAGDSSGSAFALHEREQNTRAGNRTDEGPRHEPSWHRRRSSMNSIELRNPYETPLYIFSVLVNLLIIALILIGALLLGYLNALAGEPLSGPMVDVIRVAFVALLLLVPGLVVYRQLTRAGIRGSAVGPSRPPLPDIYAVKEDFARKLGLEREPEI